MTAHSYPVARPETSVATIVLLTSTLARGIAREFAISFLVLVTNIGSRGYFDKNSPYESKVAYVRLQRLIVAVLKSHSN